jgi:hypothetical protein
MVNERPDGDSELQRQVDDLRERIAVNRGDIDALIGRADDADERADVSEERADSAELRADVGEMSSADDRRRIDDLEVYVDLDRAMILQLQAEGLISQGNAEQLEETLRTSRRIGAAIGIVMANRRVSEADAFLVLSRASQTTNRKIRVIADAVVQTGDLSELP